MRGRLLAALAVLALAPGPGLAEDLVAGVFDPPRPAPELDLEGTHGGPLRLSDYRGKVVLLGFGFSSCTEVCPVTLAVLAQARRQLGEQADALQVVYVTVDPQVDDAARLRDWLAGFDPGFVGGTGSEAALARVRNEYGIIASRKQEGDGEAWAHSSFVYLVDQQGLLRALMPYGHAPEDFAHDVRLLLGGS